MHGHMNVKFRDTRRKKSVSMELISHECRMHLLIVVSCKMAARLQYLWHEDLIFCATMNILVTHKARRLWTFCVSIRS